MSCFIELHSCLRNLEIFRELTLPSPAHLLTFLDGYLAVAYESTFTLYDCEKLRPQTLIAPGFQSIEFALPTNASKFDLIPLAVVDVTPSNAAVRELLLCFNKVGLFVTEIGYPAREHPYLKWRINAKNFFVQASLLFCIGEGHVELIDTTTGAFLQVLHLPNLNLCSQDQLLFTTTTAECTYFVQLWLTGGAPYIKLEHTSVPEKELKVGLSKPSWRSRTFTASSRRAKKPTLERLDSSIISNPSDFVHVEHHGHASSFVIQEHSKDSDTSPTPPQLSLTRPRASSQAVWKPQVGADDMKTPPRAPSHPSPDRTVKKEPQRLHTPEEQTAPVTSSPRDSLGQLCSLVNDPNTRLTELFKAMSQPFVTPKRDRDDQ